MGKTIVQRGPGSFPIGAALALGLALGLGTAHAEEGVDELRSLVEQREYEAAWELGTELRFEHEGRPRFDFHLGLAALETGRLSEAVFALERVLMRQPGSQRTRLELARAYFLLEENNQARREFERVLAQEPPVQVRATVERFLVAIQRREERFEPIYSFWVEGGLGYDDNVNAGPDDETNLELSGFQTDQTIEGKQSDYLVEVATGGNVIAPIDEQRAWFGRGRVSSRNHLDETDHDQLRVRADGGLQWMEGPVMARAGGDIQRLWRDGDAYQDQLGLQGSMRYRIDPRRDMTLFARLARLTYPEEEYEGLDADMWMAGGGYSQQLGGEFQPLLNGNLFIGNQSPRRSESNVNADRSLLGFQVGGQMTVLPEVTLRGNLQYTESGFNDRDETLTSLELAGDWRPIAQLTVTPSLNISDNEADSPVYNDETFEYSRTRFLVKARYTFD